MHCGTKVYRTDEMGEININVNNNCIKITTLVNNNNKRKK